MTESKQTSGTYPFLIKPIKGTNAYRNLRKNCTKTELALLEYISYLDDRLDKLIKIVGNHNEMISNLNEFMEIQNQIDDMFAYQLGLEKNDQNADTNSPDEGDSGRGDSAVSDVGV